MQKKEISANYNHHARLRLSNRKLSFWQDKCSSKSSGKQTRARANVRAGETHPRPFGKGSWARGWALKGLGWREMNQRARNNHVEASTRWRSTKKGWKNLCWVHPGGPRGGDPRAEPTTPPGTVPCGMQEQRRGDGRSLGMALESPRVQAGAGNPNPTAVSSRFRSRLEALPVFCSSLLREASRAGANRAPAAPKRIGHLQGNVDPIPKWGQEGSRGLPSSREWPQRGSWGGRELLQRLCPSPSPPPPCVPLPTFNPGGPQPLKSQFPRVLRRSRPHRGDRAHPQPQKKTL